MSRETPLCVHDYLNADCDCDRADDYDPSISSPTFDDYVDFACFDHEGGGANQIDSPRFPTNEHRASHLLPSLDEQVSSSGCDGIDSNSSGTAGNFGNSPNPDSDFQGYYYRHGEDDSLDNFDLRTPSTPLTPRSRFDTEDIPANLDSYDNSSSSLPAGQASSSSQFQCRECLKKFDSKTKYKAHIRYHDDSIKCPNCERKFGVTEQFKRHWREVHEKQQLSCPVHGCKKKYTRLGSVKRHIANKHGSFDPKELLKHVKRH